MQLPNTMYKATSKDNATAFILEGPPTVNVKLEDSGREYTYAVPSHIEVASLKVDALVVVPVRARGKLIAKLAKVTEARPEGCTVYDPSISYNFVLGVVSFDETKYVEDHARIAAAVDSYREIGQRRAAAAQREQLQRMLGMPAYAAVADELDGNDDDTTGTA